MIEIVTSEKLIAKYQQQFIKQLRSVCSEAIITIVGYQGDSSLRTVYYSEKYNFGFTSEKNENRYWNVFGIGKPVNRRNTSITVEINPPYEGINRNTGGAFGHNKKWGSPCFT